MTLAFDPNHTQSGPDVRLDWGMRGLEALLAGGVATVVIVDVLSWSTSVDVACARGVSVFPFPSDTDAAAFAASHDALLAGHRGAQGPTLSPISLRSLVRGSRLVLPSPNGSTLATAAASAGVAVFAGCIRNASAVAAAIEGFPVGIVAAGERWPDGSLRPAVEDQWGAARIASALAGPPAMGDGAGEADFLGSLLGGLDGVQVVGNPMGFAPRRAAEPGTLVRSLSVEARAAVRSLPPDADLPALMADAASGRELTDKGYALDVEVAAAADVSKAAPKLGGDGAFVA